MYVILLLTFNCLIYSHKFRLIKQVTIESSIVSSIFDYHILAVYFNQVKMKYLIGLLIAQLFLLTSASVPLVINTWNFRDANFQGNRTA